MLALDVQIWSSKDSQSAVVIAAVFQGQVLFSCNWLDYSCVQETIIW